MKDEDYIKFIAKECEKAGWETELEGEYDIILKKKGVIYGYVDTINITNYNGAIESVPDIMNKAKAERVNNTIIKAKPRVYIVTFGLNVYENYINGGLYSTAPKPVDYKTCYIKTLPIKEKSIG